LIVSRPGASLFGQCPPPSLQNDFVDAQVAGTNTSNPTIGMSSTSDIIVAYEGYHNNNREILARNFTSSGSPSGDAFPITEPHVDPDLTCEGSEIKRDPSLAVSSSGQVGVAFIGGFKSCKLRDISCTEDVQCSYIQLCESFGCTLYDRSCGDGWCYLPVNERLVHTIGFPFGNAPTPYQMPFTFFEREQFGPSIGVNAAGNRMLTWANTFPGCSRDAPFGWLYGPEFFSGAAFLECATTCGGPATAQCTYDTPNDPQPCISRRSDGYFLIAWSDPEEPLQSGSEFNVYVQSYTPAGAAIGSKFWVNDTSTGITEVHPSSQVSPAVAMDDPLLSDPNLRSNIVVSWAGPTPENASPARRTIYGRRLILDLGNNPPLTTIIRDPIPGAGEGAKSDFIVNNQVCNGPLPAPVTNPTVALTADPVHRGRFIIAWNSAPPCGSNGDEVHGQFFEGDGRPMGCEFRLHKNVPPPTGPFLGRHLAPSARHTIAYGANSNVAVAYTLDGPTTWLTVIPAGTAEALDASVSCCKGDVNHDGLVNGRDIQPFINLYVLEPRRHDVSAVELCPADMNLDYLVDSNDVAPFVTKAAHRYRGVYFVARGRAARL
jgi:hypothetical protein